MPMCHCVCSFFFTFSFFFRCCCIEGVCCFVSVLAVATAIPVQRFTASGLILVVRAVFFSLFLSRSGWNYTVLEFFFYRHLQKLNIWVRESCWIFAVLYSDWCSHNGCVGCSVLCLVQMSFPHMRFILKSTWINVTPNAINIILLIEHRGERVCGELWLGQGWRKTFNPKRVNTQFCHTFFMLLFNFISFYGLKADNIVWDPDTRKWVNQFD